MKSAEALSRIFHPLVVLPVFAFLLLKISGLTFSESTYWFSLWIGLSLAPTAAVTFFIGERNFNVLTREKRMYSYAAGLISITLCLILFHFLSAPEIVINLGIAGIIATAVFGTANHFDKVSIHTGTVTAIAAIYTLSSAEIAVLLALASVLIGWSRVKLDRHTPLQVMQGSALGIVCGLVFLAL